MTTTFIDVVAPPEWDLTRLYLDDNDPRLLDDLAAAEEAVARSAATWLGRTDYLNDPVALRTALDELEVLSSTMGTGDRPQYYLSLRRSIDQNNETLKGLERRVDDRNTLASSQILFFLLSIGRIESEIQQRMLTAPELEPYRRILTRRFAMAKHDFSEETTRLLSRVNPQAISAWTEMVNELMSAQSRDIKVGGMTRAVPFNALSSYLYNRATCEAVYAAQIDVLRSVAPVAAREINAVITTRMIISEEQGFAGPDIDTYMRDDLDVESVEAMLAAVECGFAGVHEFYALKSRLFRVGHLRYANRNAVYGKVPSGFSWGQAVSVVRKVYYGLDPWFAEQFDLALAAGRIDANPREGKTGSAFCARSLVTLPIYMLMSFSGTLNDVETLAHEFGHLLSGLLMQRSCNSFTYGACRPLAEVSSIFIEQFLVEALLEGADDETRLALLIQRLESEVNSIFRQTAAMRFEQALYREIKAEGYLPLDAINVLFRKHMGAYLGNSVQLEAGSELWWIQWDHIRKQFYNYSYAFACLVAKAMHSRVVANPGYISEIKRFMGAGTTLSPRELLASMDMDITSEAFWGSGLNEFRATLAEVRQLAAKLGKI